MPAFRIERDGNLDLAFNGEKLADISSREPGEAPPLEGQPLPGFHRWTEIRIYRTSTGKYVTEMIGRSIVDGERDRIDVRVHHQPGDVPDGLRRQPKNYLTKLALEALDEAAENDPALRGIVVEEI